MKYRIFILKKKKISDVEVAPSFFSVVLFLCTVVIGIDCAGCLIAPIDIDFLGGSTVSSVCPRMTLCTLGHTNCRRYSVLSFDIVFLNSPLDSPVCKGQGFDINSVPRCNKQHKLYLFYSY